MNSPLEIAKSASADWAAKRCAAPDAPARPLPEIPGCDQPPMEAGHRRLIVLFILSSDYAVQDFSHDRPVARQ
jgi:hypothetical protein